MHLFEKNIKDLGLIINEPPDALANYVPFKVIDNLVYISGQGPMKNGKIKQKIIKDSIFIATLPRTAEKRFRA